MDVRRISCEWSESHSPFAGSNCLSISSRCRRLPDLPLRSRLNHLVRVTPPEIPGILSAPSRLVLSHVHVILLDSLGLDVIAHVSSPGLIPLTILYTSLLPLILQLVLSIWYTRPPSIHESTPSLTSTSTPANGSLPLPFPISLAESLLDRLPPAWTDALREVYADISRAWVSTDRVWAGTRLLGGMAAGFGLRVILPTRPWETMGIVLAGWAAGAGVNRILAGA